MSRFATVISTARRVQYANGYVQLGLLAEAATELDAIASDERERPDVWAARIELHREADEWGPVAEYARRLLLRDSSDLGAWISLGCAVRRVGSIYAAKEMLLQAEAVLGDQHAIVHYNLACYHCLLGEPAEARRRLFEACERDEGFRKVAREDPDLASMRAELGAT